jgi:hypothetical protein
MDKLRILIDACVSILNIHIDVCGYDVALMSAALWSVIAFFLLWFVFKLFS